VALQESLEMQYVYRMYLSRTGHSVRFAQDMPTALRILGTSATDVVLYDVVRRTRRCSCSGVCR
jgi:CheY-like chemotaxis protein